MRRVLVTVCCSVLITLPGLCQNLPGDERQTQEHGQARAALSDSDKQKQVKSTPSDDRRPKMAGSSTGYIDNAVVGNQIRFRFDDDFSLRDPDRAEFFYGKCGCYRNIAAGAAYDPNAPGPGPGVAATANLQELQMNVEYAPTARFSILAETPARWIQYPRTTIPGSSGIGDFRAGFKVALLATDKTFVTFQFRTYFPTGDARLGLGTNHYSVEPTILYHQRLKKRLAVSGQFGDWHPIGGSAGVPISAPGGFAGDILEYGFGTAYDLVVREHYRLTPVVEFVGWSVLSGFVTGPANADGSGVNIVNAKLGARFSFGKHSSVYAGYGRELTHSSWYRDIFRLEYRLVL
jgi:hypothetical protein